MRKLYSLITMLLVVTAAWSQNTYTWVGANNASWAVSTNWSPVRGAVGANDTLLFNSGTALTITAVPTEAEGRVRVFNNTNITLQGAGGATTLTINNNAGDDLIISPGSSLVQTLSLETVTLGANARADISGTYDLQGAFVLSNAGVVAAVAGDLINSGGITGATAAKLQFNSGGTYTHGFDGGTVPTATWNAGSTLDLAGVVNNYPAGMTQTFRSVIFSGAFTGDVDLTADLNVLEDLTINNTGAVGNDLRLLGNFDINVGGDFNLVAGLFNLDANNGNNTLTVDGNFSQSGGTFTETGSGAAFVVFDGTTTQTFSKTGGTISGTINYTVNGGSTIDFGTSVLNGSGGTFTLSAAAKLITSNANGLTAGTGSVQTTTRVFNSGADYEFRGATTGTFTTTPTGNQARSLTVNNGSGNVTLAQAMTVTGTGSGQPTGLTLTNGLLVTTTTNLLTVAAGGVASAVSNASFVDGPMAKVGTTAFTFPVGKSGAGYRTIGISAPSTSSTFRAEFINANSPVGTITGGITKKSACEHWDLARTAGTGTARVTISWEANSSCNGAYVTELSSLVVAHLTGGNWVNEGQLSTTGGLTAGTITSNNILTTFSPFALATTAAGTTNPLPVLFDNVKAFEKGTGVQIEWSNLTERDLLSYTVERSTNGRDFTEISRVNPKSNQNDKVDYIDFDASPVSGANFYRVRVDEISGKTIYSKTLRVEVGVTKTGFSLYPNPVIGKSVTISLTGVRQGQYNVRVINANGQDVYQKTIVNQSTGVTQTLQLPSVIKSGIYTMIIKGDNYSQNQMFIVQ
jgi:hypothetical protein